MYKDRGCKPRCQEEEIVKNAREQRGDEWEVDKRKDRESEKKGGRY